MPRRNVVSVKIFDGRDVHEGNCGFLASLLDLQLARHPLVPIDHLGLDAAVAVDSQTIVVSTVEEPEVHYDLFGVF